MYVLLLVLVLFQVCLGFTGRGLFYPGRADLFELSIIHLNDFHARFEQTSPYSGVCREDHKKDCIGGIARVYTAVNQLMKERPNAIFLNAGDHFQGTLWYNIHRWNVTAVFMNMLPHDAMVIIYIYIIARITTQLKNIYSLAACKENVKEMLQSVIILKLSIISYYTKILIPKLKLQNFNNLSDILIPWKKVVDETALKKVGTTRILLLHNCYNQECNMGNLITDAMVNAIVDGAKNKTHWTYAAVACMNPGGIRSSLEESDITYGDLMMVLPFENTWDTIELTGESIRKILEMRQMLVWSGLKITYKKVNETRSLVNVKIRCQACEYPVFENLVDNQWYRMIIPNFLMNDGDGFHIFKNKSRNHKTGTVDINHFIKYVTKMSPLLIGTERRINIIE
ncbi:APY Apyrase, partial [Acromyrmex heyeri]